MIGPGIAKNEKVTIQMLASMLDLFREKSQVFLLPVTAKETVKTVYSWGARNCEIHFSQCYGEYQPSKGGYNANIHARNLLIPMHFA